MKKIEGRVSCWVEGGPYIYVTYAPPACDDSGGGLCLCFLAMGCGVHTPFASWV